MPAPMEAPLVLPFSYHCMRERLKGGRLPGLAIQASETAVTWPASEARCPQLAARGSHSGGPRSPQTCPEGGRSQPPGCQGPGLADLAGLAQNKGGEPFRRGCGAWRGFWGLLLHCQRLGANRNVSSD